jgi:aspartate racemase
MSWESTAVYYRLLNENVKARLGGLHSARILLHSVDFADIEMLQAAGKWEQAGAILAAAAVALEGAGAELMLIGTNTMHKVADQVAAGLSIPLLHIADATAQRLRAAGIKRVGLLGTRFTMQQAFYRERIEQAGIVVIVPPDDQQALVHRVIYEELCLGEIRDNSRKAYLAVIQGLQADGAQGVILGCTEIAMLVGDAVTDIPLFDTTAIHAQSAVALALAVG